MDNMDLFDIAISLSNKWGSVCKCPICETAEAVVEPPPGACFVFNCPNCGRYGISHYSTANRMEYESFKNNTELKKFVKSRLQTRLNKNILAFITSTTFKNGYVEIPESFIESQFPVSIISKESYKERKAGSSQTLTGLGKWWGRKPLVLVRAALIGALMPPTDPKKDREIFLKILTMDEDGLLQRKNKSCPVRIEYDTEGDQTTGTVFNEYGVAVFKGILPSGRELQRLVFQSLSYADKLKYCARPEEIEGPSESAWYEINEHLHTDAHNLQELVQQLGMRRFGHIPRVGDCFCGGGSNVFEPARLGCDVTASDLNPVAGMLTWGALNLLHADENGNNASELFIQKCLSKLCDFYADLGIEKRSNGYINKYYLYCAEITCPDCGAKVPLLPSRVISVKHKAYVTLQCNEAANAFDFEMHIGDSEEGFKAASTGTVDGLTVTCPHCGSRNSLSTLRERELRNWKRKQFVPSADDLFQERLYAIMCVKPDGKPTFICPEEEDLAREKTVDDYISNHFDEWQEKGYIPSSSIDEGEKTLEPIRTRGWKYWHQLFNPRQLLLNGKFSEIVQTEAQNQSELVAGLLMVNRLVEQNSKLCSWRSGASAASHVFYNQALNTLLSFCSRGISSLSSLFTDIFHNFYSSNFSNVDLLDARIVQYPVDVVITDPPYADAVNYHELTEYFLAWDKSGIRKAFPDWYADSKRALAIRGVGTSFNESMVEVYKNLANNMSSNGIQILMFTHQDPKVWAELALVAWASGLQITSAWCISTETESVGLKKGNYVRGTVLMILRKRTSEEEVYPEDIRREIRYAVKAQMESMRNMDDRSEPDFNDPDYSLAAYAAAMRVITSKKKIFGIDPSSELHREKVKNGEKTPVQELIEYASQEAMQYIIPRGIDKYLWGDLCPFDRFYIKGLDMEMKGNKEMSSYQEIARTIGITDYQKLFASTRANNVRLMTATEMRGKSYTTILRPMLRQEAPGKFPLLPVVLYALFICHEEGEDGDFYRAVVWIREILQDTYWDVRTTLVALLNYISQFRHTLPHWREDAENAEVLAQLIQNDSI